MSDVPTIQVNGEHQAWQPGLQVAQLLKNLGNPPNSVATALNGHFLPRAQREQTLLKPGDSLHIFKAIEGG